MIRFGFSGHPGGRALALAVAALAIVLPGAGASGQSVDDGEQSGVEASAPAPGDGGSGAGSTFQDCPHCPRMVVIPGGSFMMGSPSSESGRFPDEGPQHEVNVTPFALGQNEVTFAEWRACVSARGCMHRPDDRGWGRGSQPVMNVSWDDAQAYVTWLARTTGESYRLPSEAEWEYSARAGTTSARYWGEGIGSGNANCRGCGSNWDGVQTAPVGSFAPNGFGLFDMLGNVQEWTQDCWNNGYDGAPGDGSAWESGNCTRRVLRGGSWIDSHGFVRAAYRIRDIPVDRHGSIGFRVARTF